MMDLFSCSERLKGTDDTAWARPANPWCMLARLAAAPLVFLALWSFSWVRPLGSRAAGADSDLGLGKRAPFLAPDNDRRVGHTWCAGRARLLEPQGGPDPKRTSPCRSLVHGRVSRRLAALLRPRFFARGRLARPNRLPRSHARKGLVLDRMAWLWDDRKDAHPTYRAWAAADWTEPSSPR